MLRRASGARDVGGVKQARQRALYLFIPLPHHLGQILLHLVDTPQPPPPTTTTTDNNNYFRHKERKGGRVARQSKQARARERKRKIEKEREKRREKRERDSVCVCAVPCVASLPWS